MPIGGLYFSEKNLRKPVVVAASAGGVLRAKKFRETLVEQGIDTDMAMLVRPHTHAQPQRATRANSLQLLRPEATFEVTGSLQDGSNSCGWTFPLTFLSLM